MQPGVGPIGKLAITEKGGASFAFAVFVMAGVGALTVATQSTAASAAAVAGVGTLAPKMTATVQSVLTVAGVGALNPKLMTFSAATLAFAGAGNLDVQGVRIDNRTISFSGSGSLQTFGYAFFFDAERACLHQEISVAKVEAEEKVAIVPFEDRVLNVADDPRWSGGDPLKRNC